MRRILLASALIGVACMFHASDAVAQNEPWCSVAREGDGESCRFGSYEQCKTNGSDGWCVRNSRAAPAPAPTAQIEVPAAAPAPAPTPAPAQTRPARKKPDTKQGSAIIRPPPSLSRPATNIVPTRAAANISIPLPDRSLLAPQPEFNCQFDTASLEPTLASAQANPGADAARIKADYERQCYRHTELISRDRLRQLQASVGETIKAVRRSDQAGAKIPVPDQALLSPVSGFDCEFKTASVEGASAPQSSPASGQAAPEAAAMRAKLDYELQCYRHAAIIWRDRIQNLQASVGETIKAVNRNKETAVEQRRGSRSN